MKRLGILLLAIAGLSALLGGCGGEEETAVLAVAFRLDEGSPVMVAYIGDPVEDPFELPAGRYYIEALDQDDVLLSLGAVDVEDGEAVDFPPSFEAAGGVADPQRAEPLITIASFLVDVQLTKYEFLEIVTSGFTESPFGSAVEPDDASVQQLFEMYGDIAAQEDAVLAALSQIESRVGVSAGVPYVCSPWAFAPDDLDRTEIQVAFLVALLFKAQQMGEAADSPAEACEEGACWVIPLEADRFEGYVNGQTWIRKTPETLAMFNKWQEYAGKLVQDRSLTPEKTSAGQARKELAEKVRSDFQKWAPAVPPELIDEVVDFFVNEVAKAVPELASAPAAGPSQAKADTSWIEGFVQKVADKLLEEGHSGLDVAAWADDLRHCLTQYVEQGLSQEDAAAVCVWLVEGIIVQRLDLTSEELAEPEPEEPGEPEPEEPPPAEPEEPAPAEPEERDVTAMGFYVNVDAFLAPGEAVVGNTITLRFNTGGGTVTGEGRLDWTTPGDEHCPGGTRYFSCKYDGGTYDPESKELSGTCSSQAGHQRYSAEYVDDNGGGHWECESVSHGPVTGSIEWEATWEDGAIEGSHGPTSYQFELTIQES